ncbi:unnamed protein product [Ambrosiozyma monospora]|uniref:Unnamed protein product n=1 Tax=Ambrosiozyma monospora TaxID=43982 RepID=A0ACB5T8L9_AMBMO|nr:unnamed protein product [Ambrosiozyma monospora]
MKSPVFEHQFENHKITYLNHHKHNSQLPTPNSQPLTVTFHTHIHLLKSQLTISQYPTIKKMRFSTTFVAILASTAFALNSTPDNSADSEAVAKAIAKGGGSAAIGHAANGIGIAAGLAGIGNFFAEHFGSHSTTAAAAAAPAETTPAPAPAA